MNPNLQQVLHLIVAKDFKGVKDSSYDVQANMTVPGDVCFIVTPNQEGRFVFRDNDTLKVSPLLSKAELIDMVDAYRQGPNSAANASTPLTKFHKKMAVFSIDSTYRTSSGIESNDVACVNLTIKNHLVIGEENTYLKQGFCQVYEGMLAKEVILTLAKSLVDNMRRDNNLGIQVRVGTVTSAGVVTEKVSYTQLRTMKLADLKQLSSYTGVAATADLCLIVEETQMDWELGKLNFERPDFDLSFRSLNIGGGTSGSLVTEIDNWGAITNFHLENSGAVNGYAYADLEYFCQAMRGNMTRKFFFPYTNFTQPLIDPTLEYESVVFDHHYEGDAEDIQKSPAQLYIVTKKTGASYSGWTATTAGIVSAVGTALGLIAAAPAGGSGN